MENPYKVKRLNTYTDFLEQSHWINPAEAKSFFENNLVKLPKDVWLHLLTSFVDFGLKDIAMLCQVSKVFKKEFCDTGVVYDRLFVRQYGEMNFKHTKELLEPYQISSLNRLIAYRCINLKPKLEKGPEHFFYPFIFLHNNIAVEMGFSVGYNSVGILFDKINNEKIETLIMKLEILKQNNLEHMYKQPHKFGQAIEFKLKHRFDMFNIMFVIYANIFEIFGYSRLINKDQTPVLLGCSFCQSPNISGMCGDCQKTRYCGRECQEKDFSRHQKECLKKLK